MNTLKYAAELRQGAELLIDKSHAQWWFSSVTPSQQVMNWLLKLEVLPTGFSLSPLDFLTNSEVALCFLFLAEALESGDLD